MLNNRVLFAVITLVLLIATYLIVPPLYQGDAGSAVYLLNTIAASLSTIFALSLSLIMVAIQLSAGKYSPRIFDFFLRFSLNVPLVIIFVTAILHSTYMLAQVKVLKDNTGLASFSRAISFDITLMAYGFIILLVYVFRVVEILKPEKLVERIRKEVYEKLRKKHFREAIIQIERLSDIAKKTSLEMDTVTAASCIRAIAGTIYDTDFKDNGQRHWYIEHVVANINGIAAVVFNKKEHGLAEIIIDELTNIADYALKEADYELVEHIIETFSVIVNTNLISRNQLMTVQKIMSRMELLALKVTTIAARTKPAAELITKFFKTMNFLGKQIIDSETMGVTFVAKYMVTGGMGSVLAAVGEKRCDRVIPDIFYEYVDLAVRVMRKGETKNIITITTWKRKHLLEEDVDPGKVFLFLKTFLVVAAVAIYLKRYDKASLLIKALGKYYPPNEELLKEIKEDQVVVRHFFDYHRPEKYLKEAFYIWGVYHQACKTYDEDAEIPLSLEEIQQNMHKWKSLFDGMSVEELIIDDELPQQITEDLITDQDLHEKER